MKRLKEYMIKEGLEKGTSEYKKAQEYANKLIDLANTSHNNGMWFEMCYEKLANAIERVMKLPGLPGQIAATIDKTMNPNRSKMANISSKQAWILACAMVENDIDLK